jgi:hypothetical protein
LEAAGDDFVEVKMPLYPAIKLMDTVMGVDTGGGDTFDFKPELTSEPTAPEAGRIKVFSQVDFNATTEPTAPAPSNGGGDPIRYEFDGDETLTLNLYKQDDGQTFDDLAVDPTNPNTGHTPEWSNLRSGDPGLPAVQKDDAFDFTTEPTTAEAGHVQAFSGRDGGGYSEHPGVVNLVMHDGSVRNQTGSNDSIWIDIGAPPADAGYWNPSSFQFISSGSDDMGRSFDLVFPTQTAFEQPENNAVATESLEIAHEGFLHGCDDGWTHLVKIDLTEPTALERAHTPGALLFSFSSEPTWTAIAMAESGGNTDAHAPHGEDSWGLWQIDVDPAGDSGDLWVWRKQVMDGTLKDTFDFQPQLTSEPTAAEAGHVKVFSGLDTSEPTAAEPQERYTFVFDGYANTGDGGSFDDLAVDPSNPNADLRDGEYVLTGLQHVATDTSLATGDSYAGPHALYDLFMP